VADLYKSTVATEFPQTNLAGVDFSFADFRAANLVDAILSQVIQVEGQEYTLNADLSSISFDEFTDWPPDYTPPASAKRIIIESNP
jgi:uncharacterized protein YjbI with pentapeptide repeats